MCTLHVVMQAEKRKMQEKAKNEKLWISWHKNEFNDTFPRLFTSQPPLYIFALIAYFKVAAVAN